MPRTLINAFVLSAFLLFVSAGHPIFSASEQKTGSQAPTSQKSVSADGYFRALHTAENKETPQPLSQAEPPLNKYPIRAGDKLNIQVYREKDLTGIFLVDNQGYISYPLLGTLEVQGMSLEELRQRLVNELGKDYLVNPQVQVDFEESLNKSVSILGHVAKPGNYDYTPDMTLIRLISKAGGFTLIAAPKHVQITRRMKDGKTKTTVVNVDDIMDGHADDVSLESGDLVMVPESFF
jgi:polysaccharide export outer membrane protein